MDAAVQYLLENLGELLRSNLDLILNLKEQVESLDKEVRLFKALIKESNVNNNSAFLKEKEKQMRQVLNEAEDIVEMFVTFKAVQKARSTMDGFFHGIDHVIKLRTLAGRVQTIKTELKTHFDNQVGSTPFQNGQESDSRWEAAEAHEIDEDMVVGFEDEAEKILELLSGGPKELEVISITGMPGLGKTTVAKKIYGDPKIKELKFSNRAWVRISQNFNINKALLDIMNQLTEASTSISEPSDKNLSTAIHNILKEKKYLIVLDDVWEINAWNLMESAFPDNKNGSKILLTSRNERVANDANPVRGPYCLRCLRDEESLNLLRHKALGSQEFFDRELEDHGQHIAKNCKGLPLAVVVIGGILRKQGTKTHVWEQISKSTNAYLYTDDEQRIYKFLALSFDYLPYHLRVCFLYFGMFSAEFQIPVSTLIRLWLAEGMIEPTMDVRLEEIAENYLEELIDMNLVQVSARRSNGRIKTCHVHDTLREFCKKKAEEELSFCEIKEFNERVNSTLNLSENYRRLGIHSRALDLYQSFKPYGPSVRSLLFFPSKEVKSRDELVCSIPKTFMLLRVLEGQVIRFHEFPDDLSQLIHLRYLRTYFAFKTLPSEISHFQNMQTLIIDTSSPTFEIKADIWKMIKLRHLQVYASTSLEGPLAKTKKGKHFWPKNLTLGKNKKAASSKISPVPVRNLHLQTLSTISPESCTPDVFDAAPNLTKLGIRGKISKLVVEKDGSSLFENLGKLTSLKNLKLVNDASKLAKLPHSSKFPENLNKITLSGTYLKWEHMSTLGLLQKLRILKLKDNAFEGKSWEPRVSEFRGLTVLHIEQTGLVSWTASADHFPMLKCIYLKQCKELKHIPLELALVQSLQLIDLYDTTQSAAASARKIQRQLLKLTTRGSEFELSIYPQDQ